MRSIRHWRVPPSVALGVSFLLIMSTVGTVAFQNPIQFVKVISPPISSSFDISYVDNTLGLYIFADRTNNAIDLFDAKTDTFLGYAGHGQFVGVGPSGQAGPNGTTTDELGRIWAGDGNGTVKVLAATPGTTLLAPALSVGGTKRADEMADDPVDHVILVASDKEGFLTFIDTSAISVAGHFYYSDNTVGQPATVAGHATAGAGIEQPVYDRQTGLFYQAVPGSPGFVDVFSPTTRQLVATYTATGCTGGPTGLALGVNQYLLGACGNGAIAISAQNGHVQTFVPGVGGADEIWFNPGDTSFYMGRTGNLSVVNAANFHVEQVIAGRGGHTVAAYSGNNHVFSPVSGVGVDLLYAFNSTATVVNSVSSTTRLAGGTITITDTIALGGDRDGVSLADTLGNADQAPATHIVPGSAKLDTVAVLPANITLATNQPNRVEYDFALGNLKAGTHTLTYQVQLSANLKCRATVSEGSSLDATGVTGHLDTASTSFSIGGC